MLFDQDPNLKLSTARRWIIYIIGLIDSALFGGTVFGWPTLVYVLKSEGVYSNLCDDDIQVSSQNLTGTDTGSSNNVISNFMVFNNSRCSDYLTNVTIEGAINSTISSSISSSSSPVCSEQDERFALIYTLAVLCYGVPGIFVGFLLHHAGLRLTRLISGSLMCLSFVFLAITSAASPSWIFPSMILMSFSGNATRIGVTQFGDLFPKFRSTAITILSGIYAASAAVFVLFGMFEGIGVSRSAVCYGFAAIALATTLSSFLMPVHHIPYEDHSQKGDPSESPLQSQIVQAKQPLTVSLFSLSSFLHTYWFFVGLFCINNYQQSYNVWITASSCTPEEISKFSNIFSYANFLSIFVSPFGGFFTDFMIRRARKHASSDISFKTKEVQANTLPLLLTTTCEIIMYGCLLFFSPVAVYVSLAAMLVVRPCIIACSTAYLRIRFPGEHFTRLLGIYSTVASSLLFLQYPHFRWAQNQYYLAHTVALILIAVSLSNPFHLLITPLMRKAIATRDRLMEGKGETQHLQEKNSSSLNTKFLENGRLRLRSEDDEESLNRA